MALILLEIALILALVAGDYAGVVPVTSTPFFLALGWASLRRRGLRWRDVGLRRPANWGRALAIGVAAGIAMELLSTFVTVPLWSRLFGSPPDLSDFRHVVGNARALAFWLALNWTLAAFGEEMSFRGYILDRLADAGGRTREAWGAALVASSVLFGLSHGGQGVTGMAQESLAGLMLGALYLACGRNLWPPILAHGVGNTLAFVLIYLGRYPGV